MACLKMMSQDSHSPSTLTATQSIPSLLLPLHSLNIQSPKSLAGIVLAAAQACLLSLKTSTGTHKSSSKIVYSGLCSASTVTLAVGIPFGLLPLHGLDNQASKTLTCQVFFRY